jgi:hypothetical protein
MKRKTRPALNTIAASKVNDRAPHSPVAVFDAKGLDIEAMGSEKNLLKVLEFLRCLPRPLVDIILRPLIAKHRFVVNDCRACPRDPANY